MKDRNTIILHGNVYCGSRTRRFNRVKAKTLHSIWYWTSSVRLPFKQTVCLRSVFMMSSAHFHISTVFQMIVFQDLSHVFQDLSHERCRSEPYVRLAWLPILTVPSSCNILSYSFTLFFSSPHVFLVNFFSWFRKISTYALHRYQTM